MRTPIERLEEKLFKENLWLFLMMLLSEKKRKRSDLRELVHKRFGFMPGEMTSYKVLFLLEQGGYVKRDVEKYYYPAPAGVKQLNKGKKLLERAFKMLGQRKA
ncbi:MAG: hypothetical protein HY364_04430 [Candidatus Aenigmarchaeota archaeon]|nr:hypothetical protein [Candidatus Aenigmarchaeota archaeon]